VKQLAHILALGLIAPGLAVAAPSRTILIHDSISKPFSLVNELAPIQLALTRFDTSVSTLVDSKVDTSNLENADYIVLAGISGFPNLQPEIRRILENCSKPVICVGAAVSMALQSHSGKASVPLDHAKIHYRDHELKIRLDPFYPVAAASLNVLASASSPRGSFPLAWRDGNKFGFAALPSQPPLSMVFSDILLDFFAVDLNAAPSLVFVIQDFNPSCNPTTLRRISDYFDSRKMPFVVTAQMKEVPPGVEIVPRGEYLDALRYAQAHGGRIFLQGGDGPERSGVFQNEGIQIEGSTDVSDDEHALVLGNVPLPHVTGGTSSAFESAVPLRHAAQGWIIPANISCGVDGVANEEVANKIREISSFRGALAVLLIPAWMRFQDILAAVETGLSSKLPVIDPVQQFSNERGGNL
jgi:hypothetical protein